MENPGFCDPGVDLGGGVKLAATRLRVFVVLLGHSPPCSIERIPFRLWQRCKDVVTLNEQ